MEESKGPMTEIWDSQIKLLEKRLRKNITGIGGEARRYSGSQMNKENDKLTLRFNNELNMMDKLDLDGAMGVRA